MKTDVYMLACIVFICVHANVSIYVDMYVCLCA